jgi:hypothetical protein
MVSHVQVDGPSPGKGLLKDEACLLEPFRVRTGSCPEQDRVPGPVQKTDFAQDFPAEGKAPLPNQPGRFFDAEEIVFQSFGNPGMLRKPGSRSIRPSEADLAP